MSLFAAPGDGPALASLGSGSKGNGTLVRLGDELLLVDCGFTLKQTEYRLNRLELAGGDLTGILVTHEHSDHLSGVAGLAHKYRLPVYATYGTANARELPLPVRIVDPESSFAIGDVTVVPVTVPHDAQEPTQFVLSHASGKVGVLSDLGCVTPHVVESYSGCDLVLMEANHDWTMLMNGPYPQRLKKRVGGDHGHLNNQQAADLLERIAHPGLSVVLGHVSQANNDPGLVDEAFEPLRERVASMIQADQDYGIAWQSLEAATASPSAGDQSAG